MRDDSDRDWDSDELWCGRPLTSDERAIVEYNDWLYDNGTLSLVELDDDDIYGDSLYFAHSQDTSSIKVGRSNDPAVAVDKICACSPCYVVLALELPGLGYLEEVIHESFRDIATNEYGWYSVLMCDFVEVLSEIQDRETVTPKHVYDAIVDSAEAKRRYLSLRSWRERKGGSRCP